MGIQCVQTKHRGLELSSNVLIEGTEYLPPSAVDVLHLMVEVNIHQSRNELRLDNLHPLISLHIRQQTPLLFLALLEFRFDLGPPLLVHLQLLCHDVVYLFTTVQ